jgi:signal transduction histidine kinase
MRLFGFLNLKAIGGQIAAHVIVSILVLHAILAATPAAERPHLLDELARAFPELSIEMLAPQSVPDATQPTELSLRPMRSNLAAGYRVLRLPTTDDGRSRTAIVLPDGSAVAADIGSEFGGGPFWASLMMSLMFALVCVTLLGVWAAFALTRPLSIFAKAAESFSLDTAAAALPERGPEEIRALARALNRMRQRITSLIDDRTKMLAAISHDLRTPITRMRLRSEFIEDEANRSRMLADLDQMLSMLESVLSFLRNDRKMESFTLADVASTLQLVADQFTDMGHTVSYAGPGHAMAVVRPDDLRRSVTNLVENAVRFGAEVTVSLSLAAGRMTIDVIDDGPGISDAKKAAMLEPFVRGDDARNMDEQEGFGLGLSIARAITLAHGGELSLHDHTPHGLVVRMAIPLRMQGQRQAA